MSFSASEQPMEEMSRARQSKEGEEGNVSSAEGCEREAAAVHEATISASYGAITGAEGEGGPGPLLEETARTRAFEGTEGGGALVGEKQNAFNCTRVLVKPPPPLQSSGASQKGRGGGDVVEEGGRGVGSEEEALLVGSEAMEIQKLLEQQSPATAKRLILSATTQTTTTTRATTTTTTTTTATTKTKQISHTNTTSPDAGGVTGYQDPYTSYFHAVKNTELRPNHSNGGTLRPVSGIEMGPDEVILTQPGGVEPACCYSTEISNGAATSASLDNEVPTKFHGSKGVAHYEDKKTGTEKPKAGGSMAGGVLSAAAHLVKSLGGAWPQTPTKSSSFSGHSVKSFQAQEGGSSEEVARFIPSAKVIDLPLDLVYSVPDVQTRIVNYTFECPAPGYARLVPKVFPVDTPFIEPNYEDVNVPVIMSETFVPELQETSKIVQVPVARYIPKVVPVDVYVPRPFAIPIKAVDCRRMTKKATISPELYQQITEEMNPHLAALAQFNAKQRQVHNEVIEKSRELAARVNTVPPPPTRVECHSASGLGPCFDENGTRIVHVPSEGKDMRVLEKCFTRLQNDVKLNKAGVEECELTEDVVLSVYRDLNGGRLEKFSSGSVGIPMIFKTPETPQKISPTVMAPAPQLPLSTPVIFQFLTDTDNTNNNPTHSSSREGSVLAAGEEETTMIENRPDTTPTPSPVASES